MNEFKVDSNKFIEVKILRQTITASTYEDWSVRVCAGSNCYVKLLSDLDSTTTNFPWLVIDASTIDFGNVKNDGFDAVLRDGTEIIDYLSVNGETGQFESCAFPYDNDISFNNNGTKLIKRVPDGFGDWGSEQGSPSGTEGNGNGASTSVLAGEWRMEEPQWTGSTQIIDETGNGNNGSPNNGVINDIATPALVGSPGTCRYGEFDGSNDYVQVPHASELNGSNELTYMAWIRPDSWNGTRQVFAKSVHGGGQGRVQMGLFSEGTIISEDAQKLLAGEKMLILRCLLLVELGPMSHWFSMVAA